MLLKELLHKIERRLEEKFVLQFSIPEFNKLFEEQTYRAKSFSSKFYKTQKKYPRKLMKSVDGTEIFAWSSLKEELIWLEVSASLEFI
jgi:hypothetical protein